MQQFTNITYLNHRDIDTAVFLAGGLAKVVAWMSKYMYIPQFYVDVLSWPSPKPNRAGLADLCK